MKRPRQVFEFQNLSRVQMCDDGSLDEIVIGSGDCVWFHVERMDDTCYWMRIGGMEFHVNFDKDGKPSSPDHEEVKEDE